MRRIDSWEVDLDLETHVLGDWAGHGRAQGRHGCVVTSDSCRVSAGVRAGTVVGFALLKNYTRKGKRESRKGTGAGPAES